MNNRPSAHIPVFVPPRANIFAPFSESHIWVFRPPKSWFASCVRPDLFAASTFPPILILRVLPRAQKVFASFAVLCTLFQGMKKPPVSGGLVQVLRTTGRSARRPHRMPLCRRTSCTRCCRLRASHCGRRSAQVFQTFFCPFRLRLVTQPDPPSGLGESGNVARLSGVRGLQDSALTGDPLEHVLNLSHARTNLLVGGFGQPCLKDGENIHVGFVSGT